MWFKVALVILPIFLIFLLFFFYLSDNSFLVFLLVLSFERLIKVLNFFLCLNATIKLFLFFLPHVPDSRNVLEESLSCLFADITCNQMVLVPHVLRMVVNSKWTLRSHKLGYCRVIRMWNGFSIKCVLNYLAHLFRVLTWATKLVIPCWRKNLICCLACPGRCWPQVCCSPLLVSTLYCGVHCHLVLTCDRLLLTE